MQMFGRFAFFAWLAAAMVMLGGSGCSPPSTPQEPASAPPQPSSTAAANQPPLTYDELPQVEGWEKESRHPFFGRGFYMVYSHPDFHIHMNLYVYDPDGESVDIEAEYKYAAADIEGFDAYTTTERLSDEMVPWGANAELKRVRYITVIQNSPKVADTFVTSRGGKVIKIRLTRSVPAKADDEAAKRLTAEKVEITKLMDALAAAILG